MDFLQSLRVIELGQKFQHWNNSSNLKKFYGDQLQPSILSLGIEIIDNTYISFNNKTLKYKNLENGDIFCLRSVWNEKSYKCHQDLSSVIDFRMSKINYREIVNVSNIPYEYIEFKSPNNKIISSAVDTWIYNRENNSNIHTWIENYINDSVLLLSSAKDIGIKNDCGIPLDIVSSFFQFNDDIGKFWEVSLDWNHDIDTVINFSINYLVNFINLSPETDEFKNYITNYVREQWQI